MSATLIDRSEDLQALQTEGYEFTVKGPYLMLNDVPYVTADQSIRGAVWLPT